MKNWFWPGFVTIVTLTSLSLWFGTNKLEKDIAQQLDKAAQIYPWLQYNIDGRDVVLNGRALNEEMEQQVLALVGSLPQINDIDNRISLLPLLSPYKFQIEILQDEVILSGAIPDAVLRDQFIQLAESNSSGVFIDDQMSLSRGAPEGFAQTVVHIMPLAALLKTGKVMLADKKVMVDGDALNTDAYKEISIFLEEKLPEGFSYGGSFIAEPKDDEIVF